MNPADPLEQLHPLREPALVGWWPLAPGWWLLLGLVLLALAAVAWWSLRRYRANAYRRQGVAALQAIRRDWQQSGDAAHCLGQANALLKAIALRAFPRREVASASGEAWCQFLNDCLADGKAFSTAALEAQYHPRTDDTDIDAHLDQVVHWIRRHRRAT